MTYWNKASERITGFSKEEVLGSKCSDNILRHIDYNGRELCIGGCPLAATLADGKVRAVDAFLHHKEGHRVPVSIGAASVKENDTIESLIRRADDLMYKSKNCGRNRASCED